MSRAAVHINDASITVLDASKVLYREPGFALLEDDELVTGNAAFRQARINPRRIHNRHWTELSLDPLPDRRFAHVSAADLVSRQLEEIVAVCRDAELIVAVPPYLSASQLGLFLGIAGEVGLSVVAMVDASVAATRREYVAAVPVHVDMSLHGASLSRLSQPGRAQVERSELLEGCGIQALYDTWLNTIAEAFVQQSRFDPLHTADTEQMLLNNMTGWLTDAARAETVHLQLEFGGADYEAEIESLSLVGAAAPIYQQIASKLRALYRADETPAIQVTDRVARLPGLGDMLKARVGGEVFMLEPGATARGALARVRGGASSDGVSLVRQLPWDQASVDLGSESGERVQEGTPTHLLFGNTAYEIGNSRLDLGSEEVSGGRAVVLGSDMPGVSRRHCTVQRVNGRCVLEDHSRYGTFLNGHRIDGSATLQIGDTVRVGSPGFEFLMITTDTATGG